jgi:predicted nuclease with TOPRIM domain
VAIKIGIDMGAIKDLVGLVTQLTDSVKDRKFASELRNIQSMIGSIQSEHAQMHEQRIKLMTENAELKQKIISLEQEILDIKQGITASNNQSISKTTNEEEKILLLLSETETDKTSAQQIAVIPCLISSISCSKEIIFCLSSAFSVINLMRCSCI